MQENIFNLLMLILMLENGGGTANINQLVLMFLMMNGGSGSVSPCCGNRCDNGDYTF